MIDVDSIPNPTDGELRALDRRIGFCQVGNDSPEHLSAEQVKHYNEQGFLMPFEGLDEYQILELRDFFEVVLAEAQRSGKSSYSINTAHLRFGRVYDLMSHPRILGPVSDLLGPDVVAWGAHFFCKLPGDGKRVAWHQDATYWPITPTRTVTAWLAIDDANPENANMRFLPRSHLHGPIDYLLSEDNREVLNLVVPDAENYGDVPVDVSLQAGQFSMHCDLLLHGSEANESDKRRCGLTMRYAAAEVRAFHDWHHNGILVRGEDVAGNWANHSRPKE